MRVLVCPTRVAADLGASKAGDAIMRGWAATAPEDHLTCRPLDSAGVDLVEAITAGHPDARRLDGSDTDSGVLVDGVAWIGGPASQADTSRPLGHHIVAAVAAGAHRVVVGLPADGPPWDAGAGLLAVLGAEAFDASGRPAPLELPRPDAPTSPGPITELDLQPALRHLAGTDLLLATDADFPLLGPRGVVQRVDGPGLDGLGQRVQHDHAITSAPSDVSTSARPGITSGEARRHPPAGLDASLRRWAELLGRLPDGRRASVILGSGAAGGVGAALLRLGARRVPGAATVVAALDVERILSEVDLVLLAEPVLDHTFEARPGGIVARMALERAIPVVVLSGVSHLSRREWIRSGVSACFEAADPATGTIDGAALVALARRVGRTWSPPGAAASEGLGC